MIGHLVQELVPLGAQLAHLALQSSDDDARVCVAIRCVALLAAIGIGLPAAVARVFTSAAGFLDVATFPLARYSHKF